MKRKGYCKVASAILGTTVLSVPEFSDSFDWENNFRADVIGSRRQAVEIRAEVSFLVPETATTGLILIADLQYSVLYSSGDAVYSDAVAPKS